LFTKSELLDITGVAGEVFNLGLRTHLIPCPTKILWLTPLREKKYFPEYCLDDLFHIEYLRKSGTVALWEWKQFLLGGQGLIRYETDIKRITRDTFCQEIGSGEDDVGKTLCQAAEKSFPSQRIVSATFRIERVSGKSFLILSRLVLAPRAGFLRLEMVPSSAKDAERKLLEAYRIIFQGTLS